MARIDENPEDRFQHPLALEAVFDCDFCGTTFDWLFSAGPGVYEVEELTEAPSAVVECPECGHEQEETWGGWTAHTDAG